MDQSQYILELVLTPDIDHPVEVFLPHTVAQGKSCVTFQSTESGELEN